MAINTPYKLESDLPGVRQHYTHCIKTLQRTLQENISLCKLFNPMRTEFKWKNKKKKSPSKPNNTVSNISEVRTGIIFHWGFQFPLSNHEAVKYDPTTHPPTQTRTSMSVRSGQEVCFHCRFQLLSSNHDAVKNAPHPTLIAVSAS